MEEQVVDKRRDVLRKQIMSIQMNKTLTPQEKAYQMQQLMMPEQITPKKPKNTTIAYKYNGRFGCEHYHRDVLMKAPCCNEFFACRHCHNEGQLTHQIDRYAVDTMKCMHCDTDQPTSQSCNNCRTLLGLYYCDICHFWDNDPTHSSFHCNDCGLCRSGKQEDYYHCKICDTCLHIDLKGRHPCLERTSHSDCPICNELLFTSIRPLTLMKCGHAIHLDCLESYLENNYQCPYCLSSIADMTEFFHRMEEMVKVHVMPDEYLNFKAEILCNDCHVVENQSYHFVGHKCNACDSWNTRVTKTWKVDIDNDDDENE